MSKKTILITGGAGFVGSNLAVCFEENGKTFNAGGGSANSVSLLELTDICREITGEITAIKKDAKERKADVIYYVSDNSKVTSELGWEPVHKKEQIVSDIFAWLRNNRKILDMISESLKGDGKRYRTA